jgi:hypothetical protein
VTNALWGVGTFMTTDGPVAYPVSADDVAADTEAAGRTLDSLGIGRGDRVLIVGLVSECAHLVPFHEALRSRGAILSGADATPFDAPRTAKLVRQLEPRAVLGVNGVVLDGLVTEGFDLGEVFAPVPVVAARPDALDRLTSAGVSANVWAHVGPAVAVECRPGAGAHVDEAQWDVTEDTGTVVVAPRAGRALPAGAYRTEVRARVERGQCGCGRSDVRLAGVAGA